ncbi:hypothetical protein chiPu_0019411 [Chiloscyllium punctatum]|uniref:Uncharacterized protein n=1 Tax=Chiloscyllium punctatum TaxID=137246 RepID=A0A401RRS8_CHIPU|nr:hypothetical protein [Chiloscyllium punctatum]
MFRAGSSSGSVPSSCVSELAAAGSARVSCREGGREEAIPAAALWRNSGSVRAALVAGSSAGQDGDAEGPRLRACPLGPSNRRQPGISLSLDPTGSAAPLAREGQPLRAAGSPESGEKRELRTDRASTKRVRATGSRRTSRGHPDPAPGTPRDRVRFKQQATSYTRERVRAAGGVGVIGVGVGGGG